MQESANLALIEENGMVGKRSVAYHGRSASIVGSRLGKRADRARYWPAILISMIVVPMIVVLGFYATTPAQSAGPSPVDLGTAANYVILTKAGMTATGTTHIWGDIGTSPAAASDITGFDLVYTAGATYSTSALVTGSVYASDYGTPTPSTLSTAVLDMEAAYDSAAGLTSPNFVDVGTAGDIAGMTLAPGLYKWTTGVQVSTGSVTISGAASDVWIFQITGDLTLASGVQVVLSGAQVSNIFWQVSGQVTLETTSVMKGIILCKTAIVMNNGATLEGSALAQTAVTMDANYVYTPGTVIPEFSQVLIPLVGMVFVVAIVSKVRNQRK
jgi:hypothetical protein